LQESRPAIRAGLQMCGQNYPLDAARGPVHRLIAGGEEPCICQVAIFLAGRVGPHCRVRIPGPLSCPWQLTLDAVGKMGFISVLWYSGFPCLIGLRRYARTDRHGRRAPTLPRCTGGQLKGDAPAPGSGNGGSRRLRRAPKELRAAHGDLRWTEFRALRGTTCVDRPCLRSHHASSTAGAVLGRRTLPEDA
jgi:hypothetical protein